MFKSEKGGGASVIKEGGLIISEVQTSEYSIVMWGIIRGLEVDGICDRENK